MPMETKKNIQFGCVADDFTGASDVASFLTKNGVSTILYNGLESFEEDNTEVDAAIIALKCRTQETTSAVKEVITAFKSLKQCGATKLYYKYCSTFDSTKEGNIGPILDAVLEEFSLSYTILCPSLPINERIVKDGTLYVNGKPLSETHMRNHPLTPMHHSKVKELMEMQSQYPVFEISLKELNNLQKSKERLARYQKINKHFYLVPDYYKAEHGDKIIKTFSDLPLLSGGSGLMEYIKQILIERKIPSYPITQSHHTKYASKALILAGSCSEMTLNQIEDFKAKKGYTYQIHPLKLLDGSQKISDVQNFLIHNKDESVLIYSSVAPKELTSSQEKGIGDLLENAMADIASFALNEGTKNFIVAGGETSGAVTRYLGFSSYLIGKSVAPGVPIMTPLQNKEIQLVLKSGNFGQEDFFERALKNL